MSQPQDVINLLVLSPVSTILQEMVSSVELPGSKGRFTLLKNHAPIISSLDEGEVSYLADGKKHSLHIRTGFAQVNDNTVTLCVEV